MIYNELYDDPIVFATVPGTDIQVNLFEYPSDRDWFQVKRRALITMGKQKFGLPDETWKKKMLKCRHSPVRRLRFSFMIENLPSYISVHFVRHHVGCTPFVKSQRNDRQDNYDRRKAPQDAPVDMIFDFNADSLLTFFNKRLCNKACEETRDVAKVMAEVLKRACPEFSNYIQPMCKYHGGVCQEFEPCNEVVY